MKFSGSIEMLGDKSIAHRALILASWFKGKHIINNFPNNNDVLTTLDALNICGLKYQILEKSININSNHLLFENVNINCNDSGTSARLLSGYLAGINIKSSIFGSHNLSQRPMDRVVEPLNSFGAQVKSNKGFLPLDISVSKNLKPFEYNLRIPSAQIKACLILYAMFMDGVSTIRGLIHTRDHLENLLSYFDYPIKINNERIKIKGVERKTKNLIIDLPGDVSSASFIVAGAILLKGSSIRIKNICFNKHRIGFLEKLIEMGAKISFRNQKNICGEKVVDIMVEHSGDLKGIIIEEESVPSLIDEIPMLCVVAAYAHGQTVIKGVSELKIKESNRAEAIIININNMGGTAQIINNNLIITPKNKLHNTTIESFNDHRIFMAFYIANLVSNREFKKELKDEDCYKKSFSNFFNILEEIIQ